MEKLAEFNWALNDSGHVEHMYGMVRNINLTGVPADLSTVLQTAAEPFSRGDIAESLPLAIDLSVKYPKWDIEGKLMTWGREMQRNGVLPREHLFKNDKLLGEILNKIDDNDPEDLLWGTNARKIDWWRIPERIPRWSHIDLPSLLPNDDYAHGRVALDVFPYKEFVENQQQLRANTRLQTAFGRALGILGQNETWKGFLERSNIAVDRFQGEELSFGEKKGRVVIYIKDKGDYSARDQHGVLGLKRQCDFANTPGLFVVDKLNYPGVEAMVGFSVPWVKFGGTRGIGSPIKDSFTAKEAYDAGISSPMIRLTLPTKAFFPSA